LFKDTDHQQLILKFQFGKAKIVSVVARYQNLTSADLFSEPGRKFIAFIQVPERGIPR
jgi:hypothetical protein